MGPTGSEYRVLQIHPTLNCNLQCLHCYSSSSPEKKEALSLDLLRLAVSDAHREGYNVLGISGGEPFLYKPLSELMVHAKALGMITSITTNGMLFSAQRLESLKKNVDLIAISLDGIPKSHNRMRNHPRAFEIMTERLPVLRSSKIKFGFIFTLTLYNLHELEWAARFAVEQGAALLQIHPLEEAGRAKQKLVQTAPDELELSYAFLEAARLQKHWGSKIKIQFDAIDRNYILANPERIFAARAVTDDFANQRLSDLVSPLIIESDGQLVPMQHGFSRFYSLGNIKEGSLREKVSYWKSEIYPFFQDLCQTIYRDIEESKEVDLPFSNWYGHITQSSLA
ncbi:MAG: radical SAM protein [Pyrinomonadaceae bacterium]